MARSGQRKAVAPSRSRRLSDLLAAALAGEPVAVRTPQHRAAIAGFWDAVAKRVMYDDREFFTTEALFSAYCAGFHAGCDHAARPLGPFVAYMSDGSDPAPYIRSRTGQASEQDMAYIVERAGRVQAEREKRRSRSMDAATVAA